MKEFHQTTAPTVSRFRLSALITVCAVVFLIWVGAMVRMTGSGMGCPDWPKCFGMWIPPTDVSQLPENYQEIYKDRGYSDTSFNVYHTWIEYINRLIGALIGLLALITLVLSFPLRKTSYKYAFILSFAGFIMILVQGGIGAYVVRTNLHTGMISVHMVIAMLILGIFISAFLVGNRWGILQRLPFIPENSAWVWASGIIFLLMLVIQIILGTQVREQIDIISKSFLGEQRELWISQLEGVYYIHKYFYYLIVLALSGWTYLLKEWLRDKLVKGLLLALWTCLGGEIILGITMHHFHIPEWAQPMHLLLATLMFGTGYALLGVIYFWRKKVQA